MKECDACHEMVKSYGSFRIMRVHVAGKEVFLCVNCRAIWGDIRYGLVKKYGTLTKSKAYMDEVRKTYQKFCDSRIEKVKID